MKQQLLLVLGFALVLSSCNKKNNDLEPAGTQQLKTAMRTSRPFTGSMIYHVSSTNFLTCACGTGLAPGNTYTGSGTLSHLGASTSNIKPCFAPIYSGPNVIGLYTGQECASFVAANNDELYLATQPYNLYFNSNGASGTVTIDITGGTGRFAGASGSFTADVSIDGSQTVGTLTNINGTINY